MHPLLRVLGVALVSGFAQAYTVRPSCTAGNSPGTAATARASSPELRSCPPGLGATPGLRALPLRPKGTSTQPEPNLCFGATTPWLGRREASQLAIATVLGGSNVLRPEAASAMTIRQLKRALVNMIRVREGSGLLLELLNENLLDGFQDGVKLLVADTELRSNVKVACQGLIELNRESSVRAAEDKGDRIVSFITQVVEYDGWDKMNRMDIREKFQQMTPEKVAFAKRGLGLVREEINIFLRFFPEDLVTECEGLYLEMYAVS